MPPTLATAKSSRSRIKAVPEITQTRIQVALQNRFNPIRTLTPETLARQLESFAVGFIREAALSWDAIERRDINIKNVASKRKMAVARLPWEVLTVEDAPEAAASEQRDALKWFFNNLRVTDALNQNQRGGLRLLIKQMMDAQGKGFAVHEIVWQPRRSGALDGYLGAELHFVPLWFFENRSGRLRFLETDGAVTGRELDEDGWMVSVGECLMEASSVAWMYKSLPLKDWLGFCEKFGMPGVVGKTDAAKDSAEWEAMTEAVGKLVTDWAAVMNRSSTIELLETKSGGSNLPFEPLVEYMDRQIASLWRGADLSTMSSGQGDGKGASVQGEETDLLLDDDAVWIEETIAEQLARPFLRYVFGTDEALAYLKLCPPKRRDIAASISAIDACQRNGIPLGVEATRETLGLPKPDDDDELLSPPAAPPAFGPGGMAGPANPGADLTNENPVHMNRLAAAFAEDLQPLRTRVARILEIEDPDLMRSKLEALLKQLPQLLKDMNADPESARILEDALQTGLLAGAKGAKP